MFITFFVLSLNCIAIDEVDFNREIRPILSDRCFACHGPNDESNESGLRLDLEEAAKSELPSGDGFAIVGGDVTKSEILRRVLSDDPGLKMPPAVSNLKITASESALLSKWIEQGASYSKHWAFVRPVKESPPAVSNEIAIANEIDRFVLRRLLQEGLDFSAPADRRTMIRRLGLDLTGLPVSSREVEEFIRDDRPGAYERLVDRLLASPHFGERLAHDWMDAARYADTNGFSIDGGRHMWLWRDWVIHAFNSNKPYDEFLVEQIAGDLVPNASPAQLIATGFQRNNMVTHEGGTIPDENLTNYNADRVKTLGEAVLGLTLGCAQCHDHKYDPITQQDYYGLFAYFNTLNDAGLDGNSGINPRPYVQARTVLQTGEDEQLRKRINELKRKIANPNRADFENWQRQQKQFLARRDSGMELLPMDVKKVSTPNAGAGFNVEENRFVRITQPGGLAAYDVLAKTPDTAEPIAGLRIVFHQDEKTPGVGWGYGKQKLEQVATAESPAKTMEKGNFILTALSVSSGQVAADQVDLFRLLRPKNVTANSWQPDFRPEHSLDTRNTNGWSPLLEHEGPVHFTVTFDEPIDTRSTPFVTMQLNFGFGSNLIAARMEFFAMTGVDDDSSLPAPVINALETEDDLRTPQQLQTMLQFFSAHAQQTKRLRIDLANAEERLRVLTTEFSTMVMNVAQKPRETFILNRGDYSQPTSKVEMQTPDFLPRYDLDEIEQDSRLSLAKWITMPEHPLTARVYVNRLWQMMFGAGIVRTPADFGSQGKWPTHPELLDWLAVDFVESGWDIKRLVKKIAMSAVYRQSSIAGAGLLERDPGNLLLARGPRFRLAAEFVRDSALKVSGLLKPYLGGPSVNPYAPGDLWREISHYGSTPATAQTFVQDHGEKLYRRSLYTYWKRTSPPPNMAAFDAPNRETCVVSRPVTNTPLQALVTLNDVQFVEAARAFAERIINSDADDSAKIRWAVLEALSRLPSDLEVDVLSKALQRERKRYQTDSESAKKLLGFGESVRNEDIPVAEHAAWTMVSSTILNLSEFVSRN